MQTKNETLNQLARKLTYKMIQADSRGWPPNSTMGFYQPVRPQKYEHIDLENKLNETHEK